MDGDKNYLSPTKLSSSFLKMLRKNTRRRRRHSMPVATTNAASMASGRKMMADKPLNQPQEDFERKKGRQRCVTESFSSLKISLQNGKSKNP